MIIFIILLIVGAIGYGIYKSMEREKLKKEYFRTLEGTNKKKALEAGRAYYASLRNGKKLTSYDEQAINNDLNTM